MHDRDPRRHRLRGGRSYYPGDGPEHRSGAAAAVGVGALIAFFGLVYLVIGQVFAGLVIIAFGIGLAVLIIRVFGNKDRL